MHNVSAELFKIATRPAQGLVVKMVMLQRCTQCLLDHLVNISPLDLK